MPAQDAESGRSRPDAFFRDTLVRFETFAATAATPRTRSLAIGGRSVRIDLSGPAMEKAILPGLRHLLTEPSGAPDLTISAWETRDDGGPGVSPAWPESDYRREGYISGFNDGRFHTAFQHDPIILRMLDGGRARALYWTPAAGDMPLWERGAPMRPLLHEWLGRTGFVAVHGGAVGFPDGGVFVAGAGGRGKSNVALSCLNSQLFYASDDFCFLSRTPRWTVHSLYCTGKMAGGDLVRHPYLRSSVSNPDRLDREKALFFLTENFADRLIRQMPLRAIVLPKIVGSGAGRIVPADKAVAHKEIALSTIQLARWTSGVSLGPLTEFIRDLPCYQLEVGAELAEVPGLLAGLIRRLS